MLCFGSRGCVTWTWKEHLFSEPPQIPDFEGSQTLLLSHFRSAVSAEPSGVAATEHVAHWGEAGREQLAASNETIKQTKKNYLS